MNAAALRAQIEAVLDPAYGPPFASHWLRSDRGRSAAEACQPTGIPEVDAIAGGLPRGALAEIIGPASSGRTSLLISLLAKMTANHEVCALVDAQDSFDPRSARAAEVDLKRLFWVRCRNSMERALKVMDLLLHSGGFGLVALDAGDAPRRALRRIPLAYWFRFQRAVEHTPAILLLLEPESMAQSAASLVVRMDRRAARWSRAEGAAACNRAPQSCLLHGLELSAEVVRSRLGNFRFSIDDCRWVGNQLSAISGQQHVILSEARISI